MYRSFSTRFFAVPAEDANDVVAAVCLRDVSPGRALKDAEARAGHAGSGNMCRAALALAVTTMAAQGEDGVSDGFVADSTAQASAGSWLGHAGSLLEVVSDNVAPAVEVPRRQAVRQSVNITLTLRA